MKFFIVLAVALASAAAAAIDESGAPIVRSDYEIQPEGAYQYAYETGNGIYAQATGSLKPIPGENPAVAVSGSFRYTAPDGQVVDTSYVADENGFQPVGSHIPVAPPTPEAIVRSLAYIAANPPVAEKIPQSFGRATGIASLLG